MRCEANDVFLKDTSISVWFGTNRRAEKVFFAPLKFQSGLETSSFWREQKFCNISRTLINTSKED